jgi:hypothetical protein
MKKTMKTHLVLLGMVACLGVTTSLACAAEGKPTADLTVSALSKYVWRGYELSKDSIVLQPSMTVGYKGFGFNLWGNLDTNQDTDIYGEDTNSLNETDMTLSYDGSKGMVGYSLGYIYYALEGADDSQELYAGISLDTLLSPTLTIYRDIDVFHTWYTTLAVSHSLPLGENLALDLGAQIGYYAYDNVEDMADPSDPTQEYSALHDGLLSASITFPIKDNISITPQLYYSFALSSDSSDALKDASANGDDDDFIYGGVSLSLAF